MSFEHLNSQRTEFHIDKEIVDKSLMIRIIQCRNVEYISYCSEQQVIMIHTIVLTDCSGTGNVPKCTY